jgi:hypothetical protein
MTITGVNLTGASKVVFVNASSLPGNGKGHGKGVEDNNSDTAFTVTNIQVATGGSKLTCSVAIASAATAGPRLVKVETPNGDSSGQISMANTFTVNP